MVRVVVIGLLTGALLAGGCSDAPPTPDDSLPGETPGARVALHELGLLLINYSGKSKRGPSQPSDLAPYAEGGPSAYEAVKAGNIVIVWGATMPGEGEPNKPTGVIAFEKKAPAEGGLVLRQNGEVEMMTADQFKSAPRAK
jgi:hypothetical protein